MFDARTRRDGADRRGRVSYGRPQQGSEAEEQLAAHRVPADHEALRACRAEVAEPWGLSDFLAFEHGADGRRR